MYVCVFCLFVVVVVVVVVVFTAVTAFIIFQSDHVSIDEQFGNQLIYWRCHSSVVCPIDMPNAQSINVFQLD